MTQETMRLRLSCLSRSSTTSSFLASRRRHPPPRVYNESSSLPSITKSVSSSPASLRFRHHQEAAAAATSIQRRRRIPDAALSSWRRSTWRGVGRHGRHDMLRMLSICTGLNLVLRGSDLSPGGSPRGGNRTIAEREDGVESGNQAVEDSVIHGERSGIEDPVVSSAARKGLYGEKPSSEKRWDDEIPAEDGKFLASIRTRYNLVRVLEIARTADHPMAGARVLLLDKFGNVHSLYHEYRLLTNSYYDVFPSLPAIIPDGPIGIFGLAAGTAARLIHHFWPEVDMYGWELDPAVVYVARKYFNLGELEWSESSAGGEQVVYAPMRQGFTAPGNYRNWKKSNYSVFMEDEIRHRPKGRLRVLVEDALSRDAAVEGGFAGIIVDLFADGAVIPALQRPEVWREMKKKLRPGGRIMVNCGGSCVDAGLGNKDGRVTMEETIDAIAQEFPEQLSVLPLRCRGDNHIALTGPLPDLQAWCRALPECLRVGCEDWVTFDSRQRLSSG